MEDNLIGIGECRCCHQTQTLNAPVSTIEAADEAATLLCSCPQGQIVRRKMQQQKIIKDLFGDADDEQLELLNHTAEAVRDMGVETAQIKLDGGVVAKFKVKDGAVVITRAYKSERQRSI